MCAVDAKSHQVAASSHDMGIRVIQVVGDSRSIEKHAFATKDVLRYSIDPCKDVYQARNGPHRLPKFLTFGAVLWPSWRQRLDQLEIMCITGIQ